MVDDEAGGRGGGGVELRDNRLLARERISSTNSKAVTAAALTASTEGFEDVQRGEEDEANGLDEREEEEDVPPIRATNEANLSGSTTNGDSDRRDVGEVVVEGPVVVSNDTLADPSLLSLLVLAIVVVWICTVRALDEATL